MIDGDTISALQSIADSLKRLADKYCPEEERRERRPAVLSTAIYDREERERQKLRETLRAQEPKPSRRLTEKVEREP